MKWLLLGVGGIVAVLLLVTAVGASLPEGHVAAVTAHMDAPPESVWAAVSDLESLPEWWSELQATERLPDQDGRPAWRQVSSLGPLDLRVDSVEAPRLLVTTITGDQPFGGSWTYELEPSGAGTRLTVTERGQVYNPFFRFVSRFVLGYHGTLESYVGALADRLGGGPPVRVSDPS